MMIYTNPIFMATSFDTSFNWSQYMLWIAHYNSVGPMAGISSWMPQSAWCWSSWNMWQYTSTDTLSSIPLSSGNHLEMSQATSSILLNSPAAAVPVSSGADGNVSGTSGQSKRLEAIQIHLTGAAKDMYDVYYCVHAQNNGWLDWAKNGEPAGTVGFSYRLEAIKVVLVFKGGAAPGPTARPFVQA